MENHREKVIQGERPEGAKSCEAAVSWRREEQKGGPCGWSAALVSVGSEAGEACQVRNRQQWQQAGPRCSGPGSFSQRAPHCPGKPSWLLDSSHLGALPPPRRGQDDPAQPPLQEATLWIGGLLGTRLYCWWFPRLISSLSPTTRFASSHFAEEKTEPQRGWVACPKPHCQATAGPRLGLRASDTAGASRERKWSGLGWLCPHVGLLTSSTSALRLGNRGPGQCQDLDDSLPPGRGVPKVLS